MLSNFDLAQFNKEFNWASHSALLDGRTLGDGRFDQKDLWLELFKQIPDLKMKSVLEVGCNEGFYSVRLDKLCAHVTALDIRPKNIIASLITNFIHETNVDFKLFDLNDFQHYPVKHDIIYHCGVLYHIKNPIEHLRAVAEKCETLFLSNRCFSTEGSRPYLGTEEIEGYTLHKVKEYKYSHVYGGVTEYSCWIDPKDMENILHYVGFSKVECIFNRVQNGYSRVVYVATK